MLNRRKVEKNNFPIHCNEPRVLLLALSIFSRRSSSAKKLKHKFPHTLDRLMMIHGALDKHSLQLFSNKLDRRSVSDGERDKFFGQECKLARKFESAIAHFTHTHSRGGILRNFFIFFLSKQTKLRRDDTRGCDGAMKAVIGLIICLMQFYCE